MHDFELNWRLFELHYANFQSVSKAQKVHLTTLMAYLGLVWGWHIVAGGGDVTVQMLGVTLRANGFWAITPFVVTLFSLALIGSINAAGPIREKLELALKRLNVETGVGKEFVYYDLDTHKNILDYFTFLRLHPEKKHFEGRHHRWEFRHFLYPLVLLWGIFTTYYAMQRPLLFSNAGHVVAFQLCTNVLLGLQMTFSTRPLWRAVCRFLGVRKETTTY